MTLSFAVLLATIAVGQTSAPTPKPEPVPEVAQETQTIVQQLATQASKLRPLVKTPMAEKFLEAVKVLSQPQVRLIYRTADRKKMLSATEWAKLSAAEQPEYAPRPFTPDFYYFTGYGSPLVYSRVLEVLASNKDTGVTALAGKKVLDFGYGTIGQLKLMAACGAHARGVDVDPILAMLYSEPGDTGPDTSKFMGKEAATGSTAVSGGRWPAEKNVVDEVGGEYDIITSKNTLKAGYIHPAREVDERFLVKLGVSDAEFLAAVFKSLKPGGIFVIYNICPAQAPLDKPYVPHADGKSPFSNEQFEAAGFKVLEFDVDDQAVVLDYWAALGYDEGKPREQAKTDIFAWYTIVRKP